MILTQMLLVYKYNTTTFHTLKLRQQTQQLHWGHSRGLKCRRDDFGVAPRMKEHAAARSSLPRVDECTYLFHYHYISILLLYQRRWLAVLRNGRSFPHAALNITAMHAQVIITSQSQPTEPALAIHMYY